MSIYVLKIYLNLDIFFQMIRNDKKKEHIPRETTLL